MHNRRLKQASFVAVAVFLLQSGFALAQPAPVDPNVPPPGYPPAQQPAYAPPTQQPDNRNQPSATPAPKRGGFLALPYLGVHVPLGKTSDDQDAGLRLGSLLGGRVGGGMFSINGELTIDIINPSGVPAGVDVTAVQLDLTLSPLVHLDLGAAELVFGPKLGFWGGAAEASAAGQTAKTSANGFTAGLNLGGFVPIGSSVSVGGLANFVLRTIGKVCVTGPGLAEVCDSDPDESAEKVFSLAAALLI